MTPRQVFNHCLLRNPEREREMKQMASAMRMANAGPEDWKRWMRKG